MGNRIFVITLLAIVGIAFAQKARCGRDCKFRFCRADGFDTVFTDVGPRLLLRTPNVATHPFVCNRVGTGRIKVKKTGTAMVYNAAQLNPNNEPFVPIASFRKKPKFPKNYFGLKEINQFPPIRGERGVFRTKSGGKFELASDDLCVKIPILTYSDNKGKDIRTKAEDDCISFRTLVPEILVMATWDTSDDLDLSVDAPSGTRGCGLIRDQNVGVCGIDADGREQWRCLLDDKPKRGTYTVNLFNANHCNSGLTRWNIAVIVRGKQVALKSGTTNSDGQLTEFTFSYP